MKPKKTNDIRKVTDGLKLFLHRFAVDDREIMRKYPRQGGFWELGGLHMTNWTNPWTTSNMAPFDQEVCLGFEGTFWKT